MADQVSFTYDGWGNLEHFKQDLNSTVNTDAFDLLYTYAKRATAGRNTVLRTGITYPDGTTVSLSQGNAIDVNRAIAYHSGRIDRVSVNTGGGAVNVAKYDFLGVNRVVGATHPFAGGDVHSRQYGSASGSYPDLDQFNRVTVSRWSKVRSSGNPVDWYSEGIIYNHNSDISRTEHGFFDALDALFTVDDLDRIADVQVGDYSGGSISNDRLGEVWGLTQAGNWDIHKLDLTGDGDYVDAGELTDDRTFNDANEMTARDTNDDGTDDLSLAFDPVGNLTDDGESYEYIYDIRGQLTQVLERGTTNEVANYRYNGLGYMISQQFDYDANGTLDSDEWRHFVYDEQWRGILVYRGNDSGDPIDEAESDPKECYVYHAAGQGGAGSYIDNLILRDRDAVQPAGNPSNTDPADTWSFPSDGTLEERVFFCQSWRADVVLVLDDAGDVAQRAWYSPYGVPTGCDEADVTADGFVNSGNTADTTEFTGWVSGTEPRGDWNLDGSVNSSDTIAYLGDAASAMTFGGRGVLSSAELDIRFGYAGYRWDPAIGRYHVRSRVYDPHAGRWLNRDPIGYDGGTLNLYEYAASSPIRLNDPFGLQFINPARPFKDLTPTSDGDPADLGPSSPDGHISIRVRPSGSDSMADAAGHCWCVLLDENGNPIPIGTDGNGNPVTDVGKYPATISPGDLSEPLLPGRIEPSFPGELRDDSGQKRYRRWDIPIYDRDERDRIEDRLRRDWQNGTDDYTLLNSNCATYVCDVGGIEECLSPDGLSDHLEDEYGPPTDDVDEREPLKWKRVPGTHIPYPSRWR